MSDVQIQTTPEPEQGAQKPLAAERRGNENLRQNTMADAIGRGTEVNLTSQNSDKHFGSGLHQGREMNGVSPRPQSPTTSGLSVSGIEGANAKPTDHRALEGSNAPNDFRKKAADAALPDNPPVRSWMGQSKLCSSKLD